MPASPKVVNVDELLDFSAPPPERGTVPPSILSSKKRFAIDVTWDMTRANRQYWSEQWGVPVLCWETFRAMLLSPVVGVIIYATVGILFLVAAGAQIVRGGLSASRVVLLDAFPDAGLLTGVLCAVIRHPSVTWRKIILFLLGVRVGESAAAGLNNATSQQQSTTSINLLQVVNINGANHVVRIRGNNAASPVMVYMHGGPGMSEMLAGGADKGLRSQFLEEHFVVVDYDQRSALTSGALNHEGGKLLGNFSDAFCKTLTVEQHIQDGIALCEWVRDHAHLTQARRRAGLDPNIKIHLCGGSWGSILALRVAAASPSLFASPVVVRGLVTDQLESEKCGFDHLKNAMQTEGKSEAEISKTLGGLTGIPSGSFKYVGKDGVAQMLKQRALLTAYGGQTYAELQYFKKHKKPKPTWMMQFDKGWEIMMTPEVPLSAVLVAKRNVITTLEIMSEELWAGRCEQPESIGGNLSIVVAQGIADNCTASAFVEKFLHTRVAVDPGCSKTLVWFAKSGHGVCKEEPKEFSALLRQSWNVNPPQKGAPDALTYRTKLL